VDPNLRSSCNVLRSSFPSPPDEISSSNIALLGNIVSPESRC
jgi:hypothetical protein